MGDKRAYALQLESAPQLTDSLLIDRSSFSEARKITLQELVDLLQQSYDGTFVNVNTFTAAFNALNSQIAGTTAVSNSNTQAIDAEKNSRIAADNLINSNKQDVLGFVPEDFANKNIAGGYAGLDGSAKIPSALLPSYVDDVIEGANLASLPSPGETGKIYVTLDTNFEYRWSGSTYIRIVASPGSTDQVTEGATNLYFTAARVLSTILNGITFGTISDIVSTDSIVIAFGKIQSNLSDIRSKFLSLTGGTMSGGLDISSTSGGAGLGVNNTTSNNRTFASPDGYKVIGNSGSETSISRNAIDFFPVAGTGAFHQRIKPNSAPTAQLQAFLPDFNGDATLALLEALNNWIGRQQFSLKTYNLDGVQIANSKDLEFLSTALGNFSGSLKAQDLSSSVTWLLPKEAGELALSSNQSLSTNMAGLRALVSPKANVLYQVTDFGGGSFYYDALDTTSADNGGTIIVTSSGKRFKKLVKYIYVDDFGAVGDTVTNDQPAIQQAYSFANTIGATVVFTDKKTYAVSSSIILEPNVRTELRGAKFKALAVMEGIFVTRSTDSHQYNYIGGFNSKLDCNGLAKRGIWIRKSADFRINFVYIENATGASLQFGDATLGASYGARIDFIYIDRLRPTPTPAGSMGVYFVNTTDSSMSNITVVSSETGFYLESDCANVEMTNLHSWARMPESSTNVCYDIRGNTISMDKCYADSFLVTGFSIPGKRINMAQCSAFSNGSTPAGRPCITLASTSNGINMFQMNFTGNATTPFAKDVEFGSLDVTSTNITIEGSKWANCAIQTIINNPIATAVSGFATGGITRGKLTGVVSTDFLSGRHYNTTFGGTYAASTDISVENSFSANGLNGGYRFHNSVAGIPTAFTSRIHSDATGNILLQVNGGDYLTVKVGTTESTNNISMQPAGAAAGSSAIYFQNSRAQLGWDGSVGGLVFKTSDNSKPFNFNFGAAIAFRITVDGAQLMSGSLKTPNFYTTSGVPTFTTGTGAGTSPTVAITGTNLDGLINITIGSAPAGGTLLEVTLNGFSYPGGLIPIISPGNGIAAANSGVLTCSATANNKFVINTTMAFLAGQQVLLYYHCGGY